jgi:hypothetical protein
LRREKKFRESKDFADDSVSTDQHNAVDGLVAVLTVKIVGRPEEVQDK